MFPKVVIEMFAQPCMCTWVSHDMKERRKRDSSILSPDAYVSCMITNCLTNSCDICDATIGKKKNPSFEVDAVKTYNTMIIKVNSDDYNSG